MPVAGHAEAVVVRGPSRRLHRFQVVSQSCQHAANGLGYRPNVHLRRTTRAWLIAALVALIATACGGGSAPTELADVDAEAVATSSVDAAATAVPTTEPIEADSAAGDEPEADAAEAADEPVVVAPTVEEPTAAPTEAPAEPTALPEEPDVAEEAPAAETEQAEVAPTAAPEPTTPPPVATPTPVPAPTATPIPAPTATPEPPPAPAVSVPELAGSFTTIGGGQIDLGSLQGQDVVLWFWAPW